MVHYCHPASCTLHNCVCYMRMSGGTEGCSTPALTPAHEQCTVHKVRQFDGTALWKFLAPLVCSLMGPLLYLWSCETWPNVCMYIHVYVWIHVPWYISICTCEMWVYMSNSTQKPLASFCASSFLHLQLPPSRVKLTSLLHSTGSESLSIHHWKTRLKLQFDIWIPFFYFYFVCI